MQVSNLIDFNMIRHGSGTAYELRLSGLYRISAHDLGILSVLHTIKGSQLAKLSQIVGNVETAGENLITMACTCQNRNGTQVFHSGLYILPWPY